MNFRFRLLAFRRHTLYAAVRPFEFRRSSQADRWRDVDVADTEYASCTWFDQAHIAELMRLFGQLAYARVLSSRMTRDHCPVTEQLMSSSACHAPDRQLDIVPSCPTTYLTQLSPTNPFLIHQLLDPLLQQHYRTSKSPPCVSPLSPTFPALTPYAVPSSSALPQPAQSRVEHPTMTAASSFASQEKSTSKTRTRRVNAASPASYEVFWPGSVERAGEVWLAGC